MSVRRTENTLARHQTPYKIFVVSDSPDKLFLVSNPYNIRSLSQLVKPLESRTTQPSNTRYYPTLPNRLPTDTRNIPTSSTVAQDSLRLLKSLLHPLSSSKCWSKPYVTRLRASSLPRNTFSTSRLFSASLPSRSGQIQTRGCPRRVDGLREAGRLRATKSSSCTRRLFGPDRLSMRRSESRSVRPRTKSERRVG